MKIRHSDIPPTRRDFLRHSACASLGITGLVNALAQMRLMTAAMAQASIPNDPSDYKALICLFLNGGNDANNLLVPISGELRNDYDAGRGVLALPVDQLNAISPRNHSESFGLHPDAEPIADLFQEGNLAFVCNVGTLSYPIATREDYLNGSVPVPPQLFSHSDQRTQWQSSVPDKPFQSGWGGRVAELLNASYNPQSEVSMNVSVAGVNSFQVGTSGEISQYVLDPQGGAISLSGFGPNYSNALNADGSYKTTAAGTRLEAFESIMNHTHANLLEESYNKVMRSARATEGTIGAALTEAATAGVDFDQFFNSAQHDLGDQLKMIAQLIAGRGALGNNRQIFFCQVRGFDTHNGELPIHADLMTELSTGMAAFFRTTEAMGLADKVTTFTASDFNRTFTPNGNNGADHAWGTHAMVMGGAVEGRNLYGDFPELKTNGGLDAANGRGRWIPTTSVDQYSAVLAKWLGADSNSMAAIFPNLTRFNDPFQSSDANLDFMNYS